MLSRSILLLYAAIVVAATISGRATAQAQQDVQITPILAHTNRVAAVAFSRDGAYVVSGGWDRKVKLWTATGRLIRTAEARDIVRAVAFSPDGKSVISGDDSGTLTIWDAASGNSRLSVQAHPYWISSVAISNDGASILTVSRSDRTPKLWDASTGQLLRIFEGQTAISSGTLSSDGALVLTASSGSLSIWNSTTGKITRSFAGQADEILSVAFSQTAVTSQLVDGVLELSLLDAATGKGNSQVCRPFRRRLVSSFLT